MKTFYIDVYFLINFTVDVLAFYFAAFFGKVPTTSLRLCVAAALAGAVATAGVFLPDIPAVKLLFFSVSFAIVGAIATKKVSLKRKIKFLLAFLMFSALVGAGAYFLFGVFEGLLSDSLAEVGESTVNRKLLVFSIIILLSIGVFKMFVSVFSSNQTERHVEVEIIFLGKSITLEAFVDSGNLAIDPMDMRPILILKEKSARDIFSREIIELSDPDALSRNVRKRIRLIPVSRGGETHVLTGVRVDSVYVGHDRKDEVSVTVAIDKEGGDFGGYYALMPAAAIGDAVR
mgnify:CR=1 FL=1